MDETTKRKIFAHADEYIKQANDNYRESQSWIPEPLKKCHEEQAEAAVHGFKAIEWLMFDLGILPEYRKEREKNVDKNKV